MAKITSALRSVWLRSLVLAVVGLWWIVLPGTVYSVIKWVLVIGLLAEAAPALINGLKAKQATGNGGWTLTRGVSLAVAALLVALLLKPVISMLPALIGILVILYGIDKIRKARAEQRFINVSPLPQILYGILVIVVGAVLLLNPFHAVLVLFQVTGALMLVMAVMELINAHKH